MKIARTVVAAGVAGALVVGCLPAAVSAQETTQEAAQEATQEAADTGTSTDDPSVEPTPEPEPEPTPEPEKPKKHKKPKKSKKTKKQSKRKPATRVQLAKNLGKTAKSSRAYKTTGTKYKVGKAKAGKKLIKRVSALRRYHRVEFAMVDLKTGATLASQSGKKIYSASCLKGPYVAALNKYKKAGTGAGTKRLERETVVHSDNDTYDVLFRSYGPGVLDRYAKYAQVGKSYPWHKRKGNIKPADLAKLWVANYWYFFKDTNNRSKYVRSLYTHGTQSFIYQTFRGKKRVYAKPGWYPGAFGNVHNDAGIVTCKLKVKVKKNGKTRKVTRSYPYVVCVMSGAYGSERSLRGIVRQLDKVHAEMVKTTLK